MLRLYCPGPLRTELILSHGDCVFITAGPFGALVLCIRGNGIIHRARGLYRRSYFGPRTCGGGIPNSSKYLGALNQGFPFSLLQCRQGNMGGGGGLQDIPEYKLIVLIKE